MVIATPGQVGQSAPIAPVTVLHLHLQLPTGLRPSRDVGAFSGHFREVPVDSSNLDPGQGADMETLVIMLKSSCGHDY